MTFVEQRPVIFSCKGLTESPMAPPSPKGGNRPPHLSPHRCALMGSDSLLLTCQRPWGKPVESFLVRATRGNDHVKELWCSGQQLMPSSFTHGSDHPARIRTSQQGQGDHLPLLPSSSVFPAGTKESQASVKTQSRVLINIGC